MNGDAPTEATTKLLLTGEHPCPYLDNQLSRNLVVEPGSIRGKGDHTAFSSIGFRRSGDYLYRPHCRDCSACIPIRVPAAKFEWRRRHRRCWQKNQDLEVSIRDTRFDPEAFNLYQRYQATRHAGGPMAEGDEHDYQGFIQSEWASTTMVHFYLGNTLAAVAVVDWLEDGLAAVYTFFDPNLSTRSLGQFSILWQIEEIRHRRLPYVYLGYWVQSNPKMAYKNDYRPAEIMIGGHWRPLIS